jgi:purine-binding chemotaxis protein CheW
MEKSRTKDIPEKEHRRAIQWESILDQLEENRLFLEKEFELTGEKRKKVLKNRAKALAQEPEKMRAGETCLEVLEFILAHERYAIETPYIREVYPMKDLTELPCTPSFVRGIINVRGQLLSVIDMKIFFNLPEKGITNLNKVIIVKKDTVELGILSDEIIGIRNIRNDDLQLLLPTLSGIQADYLKGVTSEGLVVLEIERLITDDKIIVNEEVL